MASWSAAKKTLTNPWHLTVGGADEAVLAEAFNGLHQGSPTFGEDLSCPGLGGEDNGLASTV